MLKTCGLWHLCNRKQKKKTHLSTTQPRAERVRYVAIDTQVPSSTPPVSSLLLIFNAPQIGAGLCEHTGARSLSCPRLLASAFNQILGSLHRGPGRLSTSSLGAGVTRSRFPPLEAELFNFLPIFRPLSILLKNQPVSAGTVRREEVNELTSPFAAVCMSRTCTAHR